MGRPAYAGFVSKPLGRKTRRCLISASPHHQDSALYPFIVQLERAAAFARDDTGAASGDISYRVPNCSWRRPSHSALASHRAAIGITTSATPVVLSSSHRSSATDQAI
jgi:hypothetical protein